MAITVYPEGDFIVFKDTGGVVIETAQYSQIRWVRTSDGNIAFENIADEFRVIATAPVGEILDELAVPYGATIDLFNAAFTAVLPQTGEGGSDVSAIATRLSATFAVTQTLRSVAGAYEASVGIKRLTLIAGVGGSFTVGAITYPFATANGVVDSFIVGNGINPLPAVAYTLVSGTVLEIKEG